MPDAQGFIDPVKRQSSFGNKKGVFAPPGKIDKALPLYLQADELIYDTRGNRVIARGNVEIYYNNYILMADEVAYDQSAGTLMSADRKSVV